ncbi:DUF1376 domain-containing protein [Terriglobus sp. RCC_193]|uniref:DUF1376 domain-containing protein n=1 Tax=Terriglobus sp. RCC_193 TaxID=3239218 RepID=UPI003525E734
MPEKLFLPWVKFWAADFLNQTDHLDDAAFRAYTRLYIAYWYRQGLPSDMKQLQRLAQLGKDSEGITESVIGEFFEMSNGSLRHDQLDASLAEVSKTVEANQRRGLKARQGKAKSQLVTDPVTASLTDPYEDDRGKMTDERREREKKEDQMTEADGEETIAASIGCTPKQLFEKSPLTLSPDERKARSQIARLRAQKIQKAA